jgi:hypothetical protein
MASSVVATRPSRADRELDNRRIAMATALGGALSTIGNLILFGLISVASITVLLPEGPGSETLAPLSVAPVIGASVVPAFFAGSLLMLLNRFSRHPRKTLVAIAAVVFIVSMFPVLSFPVDVGTTSLVVLGLMHAISAVAIVTPLLRITARVEVPGD